jgi:acetyl-CoA synthetase
MPILGPNCYGFVNALDRVALWPDQHGCAPVDRGVAILTQSSNIAINLTMQRRALPLAVVVACGNMAQTSQARIAADLLDDPRITAIGLHVEGFGSVPEWEALAARAHAKGIPLVALKVGASAQAQGAAVSHTASLAGSDAGARALLDRLGIARVHDLPGLLETLKLLHVCGPLDHGGIASISCSGGEASLIADMALGSDLIFPPLTEAQRGALRDALGPKVALANPLDYHTYIWRDAGAMAAAWGAMTGPDIAMTLSIVDYPHTDAADWACATEAALAVRAGGAPFAVAATLPELMPEDVAARLIAGGVAPLQGLGEALTAIAAAQRRVAPVVEPVLPAPLPSPGRVLGEHAAKKALAAHGLEVPRGGLAKDAADAEALAKTLNGPLAVKGTGMAHKSEHGAVRLNLPADRMAEAAGALGGAVLVEEMATGGVAELLVGITADAAHGYVLTLGAGGVLTELLADTVHLLVPVSAPDIRAALARLRSAPLLTGYRGKPPADMDAIVRAVLAIQDYVIAHAGQVQEVEVNPLICTPDRAVAADALIRQTEKETE